MISTELSNYLYGKASAQGIPLMGSFELSPVCNFHCKMCYVRKTPQQLRREEKTIRDDAWWLSLAEECKKAGTLFLLLTGGEPFLYPNFRKLYMRLHRMGFILYINSNGSMITEETVSWLCQAAPARINITLYGASPETYGRVCGDPGGYQRTVDAIDRLRAAGIPVVINVSPIPENYHDLADIVRFCKERNLQARIATYMFPPTRRQREQDDSRFSPEQAAALYVKKFQLLQDADGFRETCRYLLAPPEQAEDIQWGAHEEHMLCRAGKSSFWVSWEGEMSACGLMPFPAQYPVTARNFLESWKKLTEKVRSESVLAGCAQCKNRRVCRPCAAMLYTETGDVNQKAPYMCQMAQHIIDTIQSMEDSK